MHPVPLAWPGCRQKKERKERKRRSGSGSASRSRSHSKRRRRQLADSSPAQEQQQRGEEEQQQTEALDADAAEAAAWEAAARLVASLEADGAPPEAGQEHEEELAGFNPEAYDWSALEAEADGGGAAD